MHAPWLGVDPVSELQHRSSWAFQTIVSRRTQLSKEAAVISVRKIHAGIGRNIIPETVGKFSGTIRTFDPEMQKDIHEKLKRTVTNIAESAGAKAELEIFSKTPVPFNNPELPKRCGKFSEGCGRK